MMKITIRKAVKSDCEAMLELIKELAVYEKAPDAVTVELAHFIESGFGKNPVWWAFVATVTPESAGNETGVGFALYYIRYSTWKGQRLYLEDLIVTEEMRGQGLGKLLFDALIEEGKNKKLSGIAWQVLDWNEPAINFYKKLDGLKIDNGWLNCSIEL